MFVLSKVPELGDTLFIVLRKQPLIFLHWYHHATVLVYSWYININHFLFNLEKKLIYFVFKIPRYAYTEYTAPARYYITMNFTVHSFMYSYYALKAMHYRVPRFVSMAITVAQLSQMVAGCAVNLWAYQVSIHHHQQLSFFLLLFFLV